MLTNQNNTQALAVIRAIQQIRVSVKYMKAIDADRDRYYAEMAECPGGDDVLAEVYADYGYALGSALKVVLGLPDSYAGIVEYNSQMFKLYPWGAVTLLNPFDEEVLAYWDARVKGWAAKAAKAFKLGQEGYVYWVGEEDSILWVANHDTLIAVFNYCLLSNKS